MKRRIECSILAGVMCISNFSFALISQEYIDEDWETLSNGDEYYKWGCILSDMDVVGEEGDNGDLSVYALYENCDCDRDVCSYRDQPEEVYTFDAPVADIEFNIKNNKVVKTGEIYYEQGVTIKEGTDYALELEINNGIYKDSCTVEKRNNSTGKLIYTTKYKYEFKNEIGKKGLTLGENKIDEVSAVELDYDMGEYLLKLEAEDVIKRTKVTERKNKDETEYTEISNSTTITATRSASDEIEIYIGPYPTIYYEATLDDNNKDSHIDTLSIKNMKMTCTYEPESITFELYNKYGKVECFNPTFTIEKDTEMTERSDELGYNIDLRLRDPYSLQLDRNINPNDDYYLKVLVNDERSGVPDTARPDAPKYAKFGNPGF